MQFAYTSCHLCSLIMSNYSYLDLDLSCTYLKDLSNIENAIGTDSDKKLADKCDEKKDDISKQAQPINAVQSFDIGYEN